MKGRDTTGQSSHTSHNICNQFSDRMLQSGEKYENYHGPERTCLCSRYHAIYGRDTTDQKIFVISEFLMRIITHHTSSTYTHRRVRDMSVKGSVSDDRVWTYPFCPWGHAESMHIYATDNRDTHASQEETRRDTTEMRVLGPDVNTTTPPPQKHHHTTTSPHHHNLAKHRIVLVLGPDASTCLLSCRLKGRDTTDQNIFVISELLMRIITHHTSSTYTHRRVRDMSVKGS